MPDRRTPSAEPITLHLLDSSHGRPVQTWRFREKTAITIGRSADCDVVIADAHVSRTHAKLLWQGRAWTLVSTGRHGTLVCDRLVAETELAVLTTFRLGANGPLLRFEPGAPESHPSETIDSVPPDFLAMLDIDVERQQQEADEIAGKSLFRELQERVRRAKLNSAEDTQMP